MYIISMCQAHHICGQLVLIVLIRHFGACLMITHYVLSKLAHKCVSNKEILAMNKVLFFPVKMSYS